MSTATLQTGARVSDGYAPVFKAVRRRAGLGFVVLAATLAYLTYTWFAFGVPDLIAKARPERAVLLGTDSIAYKVHITRILKRDGLVVSVEGERTAEYQEMPDWLEVAGNDALIDLGGGYRVEIAGPVVRLEVPAYGIIEVRSSRAGVETILPGPAPEWARINERKFDARPTLGRRVQVSRAKIEVHRYYLGWENFFFPFSSELSTYGAGDIAGLVLSDERLRPDLANWHYVFDTVWNNPGWQHGAVFVALLETMLMAVLGTLTAALVGLPLALLAASNFTPSWLLRFAVRRLFDFLRGIDMLIWSLIFIRAFGLGPLTGALAIAFTDTGTLGKLFSEALENIDQKQVEGVDATGASRLQRFRFGVLPQILPVFISQTLYYLESNTRSATVIGSLGAGGIGLLLVETMRTARDWENTLYIILLVTVLVMVMDSVSSRLRRYLIQGREQR